MKFRHAFDPKVLRIGKYELYYADFGLYLSAGARVSRRDLLVDIHTFPSAISDSVHPCQKTMKIYLSRSGRGS